MREDTFKSDPLWTVFANIETALNGFSQVGKASQDFTDLKKQLEYVRWVIEKSDPGLIMQQEMNQTASELGQILAYLPSDAANWQYASAIQNQMAPSLVRFSQIRQKRFVRSEAANLIAELTSEIEQLKSQIQEAMSSNAEQASAVKNAVSTEYGRVKKLQDEVARIETLVATKFESWEAKIDADYQGRVANWTAELSLVARKNKESLDLTSKNFSEEIAKGKQNIESIQVTMKNESEAAERNFLALYSKIEMEGVATLENLTGIYEQAGQIALSGGFVEAASKEEKSYQAYAKWASGFFIVSAIVLAVIWYDSVENKLSSLSDVVLRLPISIVLLLPAFYFASLASKHRKTAVSLRSLGLRIKAFDAYTIKSTEKDRQKLREDLAPVFFDDERAVAGKSLGDDAFLGKLTDRVGAVLEKAMDKLPNGKE